MAASAADSIQEDRKRKDEAVRATIMQKLIETGEKERLKEMLREKLIETGWRDDLREYCKGACLAPGPPSTCCARPSALSTRRHTPASAVYPPPLTPTILGSTTSLPPAPTLSPG